MKYETFIQRVESGKSNSLTYSADNIEGLINVWKHSNKYIVTWEECPPGEQFDESQYTRDERREFNTLEQALEYLRTSGIELESFTP